MRAVRRLRRVALLGVLTVIVGLFAVLAVADPFHLRHARWFTAALVLLGILLLTATLAVAVGRGILRVLVLIVGAVAALGWGALIGVATQVTSPSTEVSQVADGGRRLVVLEGSAAAIDPIFAVVVRNGTGPFEQETLVYQGVEAAPAPTVRFVDGNTVEVRLPGGCLYRSEVEAMTLAVDPVHRPLRADGC
jgi:hypothetical protein